MSEASQNIETYNRPSALEQQAEEDSPAPRARHLCNQPLRSATYLIDILQREEYGYRGLLLRYHPEDREHDGRIDKNTISERNSAPHAD